MVEKCREGADVFWDVYFQNLSIFCYVSLYCSLIVPTPPLTWHLYLALFPVWRKSPFARRAISGKKISPMCYVSRFLTISFWGFGVNSCALAPSLWSLWECKRDRQRLQRRRRVLTFLAESQSSSSRSSSRSLWKQSRPRVYRASTQHQLGDHQTPLHI